MCRTRGCAGKLLSPDRRRRCIDHLKERLGISERRACRTLGQHRSTQRQYPSGPADEASLTANIIELARTYGRYGYRRVTALLNQAGWHVNHKRVQRIWRREGLKVPQKQPKKGRLWLNDGSCIRLRPEHPNHVWSYDFVHDRTDDGRVYRSFIGTLIRVTQTFKGRHCLDYIQVPRLQLAKTRSRQGELITVQDIDMHVGYPKHDELVRGSQINQELSGAATAAPGNRALTINLSRRSDS